MKERYEVIKKLYPNYLILIIKNSKYYTFDEDKLIFNYLKRKLNNINYIILDNLDIIVKKEYENNYYYLLKDSKLNVFNKDLKLIIDSLPFNDTNKMQCSFKMYYKVIEHNEITVLVVPGDEKIKNMKLQDKYIYAIRYADWDEAICDAKTMAIMLSATALIFGIIALTPIDEVMEIMAPIFQAIGIGGAIVVAGVKLPKNAGEKFPLLGI